MITPTVTAPKPSLNKTWEDVFTNGDDVVGLNLINPEVVKLLSAKSKEDLSESASKEMLSSITDLNLNAILFKSNFNKMIFLHHNLKIGGGLLNPKVEHYGLFGNGAMAIPFKWKPASILKINKMDAPSWDTIKTSKSPEDLEATREAMPNLCHFTSAISIPPFLTKALMRLNAPSVSDVFLWKR